MVETAQITGHDYAQFAQTDTATAIGMREAFFNATKEIATVDPTKIDKASAKEILHKHIDGNEFLKAAGTGELVSRYFDQVLNRNSDADVKAFLSDITHPTKESGAGLLGALMPADVKLGIAHNDAAHKHLHIQTLTEDFRAELKKEGALVKDITITPSAMGKNAETLSAGEKKFRAFDKLSGPEVGHLISHSDPQVEKALGPVIEAATRLKNGEPEAQARKDMALIKETLTGKKEEYTKPLSAEEAKHTGQQLLNTAVRMRAGEKTATAGSMLEIVDGKGKAPAEKRPEKEINPFTKKGGYKENENPLLAILTSILGEGLGGALAAMLDNISQLTQSGGLNDALEKNKHIAAQHHISDKQSGQLASTAPQVGNAVVPEKSGGRSA